MENTSPANTKMSIDEMFQRQMRQFQKAMQGRVAWGGWIRNPRNLHVSYLMAAEYLLFLMLASLCMQARTNTIQFANILGSGVMGLIELVIMCAVLILAYKVAYKDSMPLYVAINTLMLAAVAYGIFHLFNALLYLAGAGGFYGVLQLLAGCVRVLLLFKAVQAAGQDNAPNSIGITLAVFLFTGGIQSLVSLAGSMQQVLTMSQYMSSFM